ncbi:VOC family protein [Gammaproteobacteria bacterium]|nr:VOC family protein [Gammaproteobacteria bacterium]
MNLRRKLLQLLAVSPFLAQSTASAQSNDEAASDEQSTKLRWGHININVSDLDASIKFYEKLGFGVYIPSIPYIGLTVETKSNLIDEGSRTALGLPQETLGRACIMQLDNGYPKLDLTQLNDMPPSTPLNNTNLGLVRMCLATVNLEADYKRLIDLGVDFISPPMTAKDGMAEIAVCIDPDGTLIELIQVHLDKWRV